MNRRKFLFLSGAAVAAGAGLGLYTWRLEPHWLQIVRRRLPIRNLPGRLSGKTLAQLSDIHVGSRVDDGYVIATFQRVAALRPDIVVFTGDFISYQTRTFDQMREVYQHLPRGRIATLAILGNHDYGPAWSHPEIAQRIADILTGFGVTVLRNRIVEIEGLQVAGLDDFWGTEFAPRPVVAAIDSSRPAIVLSHNPDTVDLPVWAGYEGWILSGHTHGGQCKPPFLPPPLLPVRNKRYTFGEFALDGNRRLYINRGVGYLRRVRFNVRPEVTLFEMGST